MQNLSRRHLVGAAALTRMAFGQAQDRKLKLGLIGCGWYGMVDLNAALEAGNVEAVVLSDVDSEHLETSAAEIEKKQGTRPRTVKDYRDLLDTPGLDAVIIGTPPHWHALQFIAACRKGLNVYLEKPVSYDIREGRAMVDAWKKAGNVVQVGFQRRQANGYAAARDYVRSGKAGRIRLAEAQIHYSPALLDNKPQDPPSVLDWDAWCGPAPKLPYSPQIGHKSWRLEKEYGHGHLVDWGIHVIDATRVILDESAPKAVHATGGLYELKGRITTPDVLTATFEFEKCPVVWRHKMVGAAEYAPETSNGVFLYGDNATIFATDGRWMIIPRAKGEEKRVIEVPEARENGVRHMAEFLNAVRAAKPAPCSIEDAYRSTTTVHLAMVSYESGTRVEWDARTEQVGSNPAAAKLLKRPYRKPYMHPHAG
jgi:predicted dehydrogenase